MQEEDAEKEHTITEAKEAVRIQRTKKRGKKNAEVQKWIKIGHLMRCKNANIDQQTNKKVKN